LLYYINYPTGFTYLIFIKAFFSGVNHYVHTTRPVEIMKISIHHTSRAIVLSCYLSIVRIFGLHVMKETFRR